jgi:hypothetical protein
METEKHHYRNVFKSDHLGSADLEDFIEQKKPLVFTIKEVKQEFGAKVAGKKGDFNIAYFVEPIKPLVLNATNSKQIKAFAGGTPFVENWKNITIELYIDENVKAVTGGTTQGVRIRPIQPIKTAKPEFTEKNFEPAKKANATIEMIEAGYTLTEEMKSKYLEYASAQ